MISVKGAGRERTFEETLVQSAKTNHTAQRTIEAVDKSDPVGGRVRQRRRECRKKTLFQIGAETAA